MFSSIAAVITAASLLVSPTVAQVPATTNCGNFITNTTKGPYTLCGVKGTLGDPQVSYNIPAQGSADTCLFACKAAGVPKCLSYSYNAASNRCILYRNSIINQDFTNKTSSSQTFWSTYCFTKVICGFYLQTVSSNPNVNGLYIQATERKPTYGSLLVSAKNTASKFLLNTTSDLLYAYNSSPDQYAEQSVGVTTGRIYFTPQSNFTENDGFAPLACNLTIPDPNVANSKSALECSSQQRTGYYGCPGVGENAGWFMGGSNPPSASCAKMTLNVIPANATS